MLFTLKIDFYIIINYNIIVNYLLRFVFVAIVFHNKKKTDKDGASCIIYFSLKSCCSNDKTTACFNNNMSRKMIMPSNVN